MKPNKEISDLYYAEICSHMKKLEKIFGKEFKYISPKRYREFTKMSFNYPYNQVHAFLIKANMLFKYLNFRKFRVSKENDRLEIKSFNDWQKYLEIQIKRSIKLLK